MTLAQALGLGDGSGNSGTGSFVEARLGWTRTGPGGRGVDGLLALLAPATTWVAGAVRIGLHGWRVCRAGHPLTSGRGAGVCRRTAGGWRAAGGHPLRCISGAGRDCRGKTDSLVGWAWKGARSDNLSVEQDVGQGTESLSFAVGQWCEWPASQGTDAGGLGGCHWRRL
jgi:hypothetical protein